MNNVARRVLLIEDNEQNAYLARYLLENAGFAVQVYANPAAGMEAALSDRPDIVLLDIQLPDMDGYEVARRLRAEPTLAGLPIVALSSFALPGEKARALAAGCVGYIEKPIKALTFVERVRGFLSKS